MIFFLLKIDYYLVRPLLNKLFSPAAFVKFYSLVRIPFLKILAKQSPQVKQASYSVELFKNRLKFRNDLGNAAGFDKDASLLWFNYAIGAGFAVVGTVLDEQNTGNVINAFGKQVNPWVPLPNSQTALNTLGLPSQGVDVVIKNIARFRAEVNPQNFPIGVSVACHPKKNGQAQLDALLCMIEKLLPHADFLELNESCPNLACQQDVSAQKIRLQKIVELRNQQETYVPLVVKLASFGDVEFTIPYFAQQGIDALAGVNTQTNYQTLGAAIAAQDKTLYSYYTNELRGGVSGRAIKAFAADEISKAKALIAKQNLQIELIQVGGIASPQDVARSRECAVLREWYTGFMEALATKSIQNLYQEMVGQ